jgi:hypothetical protein
MEPVLICPTLVATAMSAMVVSSVSPERCETMDLKAADFCDLYGVECFGQSQFD